MTYRCHSLFCGICGMRGMFTLVSCLFQVSNHDVWDYVQALHSGHPKLDIEICIWDDRLKWAGHVQGRICKCLQAVPIKLLSEGNLDTNLISNGTDQKYCLCSFLKCCCSDFIQHVMLFLITQLWFCHWVHYLQGLKCADKIFLRSLIFPFFQWQGASFLHGINWTLSILFSGTVVTYTIWNQIKQ